MITPLWLHRTSVIVIAPFVWAAVMVGMICAAPIEAARLTYDGLKRNWS